MGINNTMCCGNINNTICCGNINNTNCCSNINNTLLWQHQYNLCSNINNTNCFSNINNTMCCGNTLMWCLACCLKHYVKIFSFNDQKANLCNMQQTTILTSLLIA